MRVCCVLVGDNRGIGQCDLHAEHLGAFAEGCPEFLQASRFHFKHKVHVEPAAVLLVGHSGERSAIHFLLVEHLATGTVDELAERQGKDPVDAFFDLAAEESLETVYTAGLMNSDEDEVEKLMREPGSLISLSDAGAHLRYLCDAAYGLHLLGHWVRERGAFDLTDAVRRLTSLPADLYRIPDRGRIKAGAFADLLLFDPATVARGPLRRAFDLPGGESRLTRDGLGVHGVWVNGQHVFDGTDYVAATPPGAVIDSFAA